MKYLMNGKRLARAALAIVLVGAVAASLWFAAPSQVAKALLIGITNPAGDPLEAGIVGQTYYFKVKVTIQEGEHLPIQNIGLSIFNSTNASSYTANLTNLPLTDGGSANYTNEQTGGGTVNITAAAANFGWRSGDGFVIWKGYAYYFPTSYGYGALTGTANMTYTIAWTPPASWPVGNYKVETKIIADSRTFTELSTEFPLQSGLLAETSISQGLSSNVTVAKVNIDRIKNLSDNSTATIPGGIGSYTATVSSNVSSAIQFLAVNGVSPFDSPSFNATTGVFSVANVTSPIQPSNTTVAEVVPILTGNTTTNLTLTIAFQIISAADQPGLNVPEEAANTIALLRGDADKNGMISIVDSLAIKQYLVSQLTLAQINPINAGSPKHDGAGGDIINVVDALAIEQFLVGQIGPYYQ